MCTFSAHVGASAELVQFTDDPQYEEIKDADPYDEDGYLSPTQQETSFQQPH